MAKRWSAELELIGAGGEPVDLWRTLTSHGVADLPPQVVDEDAQTLEATLVLPRGRARSIRIGAGRPGFALVEGEGVSAADGRLLTETARHMLRLDADLSGFYDAARDDPDLAWVSGGAGRMLRSPTVFEDVVKTICTTNCAWSATVRMTTRARRATRASRRPTGAGRSPRLPRWPRSATTSIGKPYAPGTEAPTCARWHATSPRATRPGGAERPAAP